MNGIAVAVLTEDRERLAALQQRVDATQMGRTVFGHLGFPSGPADPVLRQVQDVRAEVILLDLEPDNAERAIQAIELIRANTTDVGIFAIGEMVHPPTIVSAMRAGAGEYIERNTSSEGLLEAFNRFAAVRGKARTSSRRARVFTVANAKGGAGATTVAVNTAIALQELHGRVLLVDFASLGHAALHLNLRPSFGVVDALQNLHRLDSSLLDGLLTPCRNGMQLLAGPQQPFTSAPTAAELARLFDLLVANFSYVVVDCSGRVDQTTRLLCDLSNAVLLVAQTDVVSLWSASRIRAFLEEGVEHDRVRLVLNRYKKIPGFSEEDVEAGTNCKLLWKVPNNYQLLAPAIDKGSPVALQESQDLGRSFRALAAALADASATGEGSLDLVYQHDGVSKKKASSRLLITPLRAGQ
jgi:pilus assembly protein CpaE